MDDPKTFLSFQYPEVKDLCKQFLTLISAILVFSITFSEKIVDFQRAPLNQRMSLLASWVLLVVALISCGLGLCCIFIAAESANGSAIYNYGHDFKYFTRFAYAFLDFSGISFVVALIALILAALPNVIKTRRASK